MENQGALRGIRVLDFSRFMQGPHCSQMLGDMGAEIIKVERVGTGDENRSYPFNLIRGVNAFFLALNRNKRSITVDLRDRRGKEIIHRLVPHCDVVLENFRPGTMEKLGFGYEELSRVNSRIIYCSCSGYGQNGPYRDKPGQDLLAQALSGLAWVTGKTNGPPQTAGTYIADAYSAILAALGIMMALFAREKTGKGQKVEVCLLDAAIHMQCQELTYYLNGGHFAPRTSREIAHPLEPPPYGIYETSDGRYIAVSSGSWPIFCDAMGIDGLEKDSRFDSPKKRRQNNAELYDLLRPVFKQHSRFHWLDLFEKKGVWSAPVYSYEEVPEDPQVKYNGLMVPIQHSEVGEIKVIGNPIRMSETPPTYRTPPPLLGQDTESVLLELGFEKESIETLKKDGVI